MSSTHIERPRLDLIGVTTADNTGQMHGTPQTHRSTGCRGVVDDQLRSNRSLFMTLTHAATKSSTNFSLVVVLGVDLGQSAEL